MEKVKKHFNRNKDRYLIGGIAFAGITGVIVGGVASQHISRGIAVTAKRGIAVQGKSVVMNNVSYISANRKGSPSWVVRCIETGLVYTSQRAAAIAMDLSESDVSQHLNGRKPHAQGYTFEQICMAA